MRKFTIPPLSMNLKQIDIMIHMLIVLLIPNNLLKIIEKSYNIIGYLRIDDKI